jgi:hypothetical protein
MVRVFRDEMAVVSWQLEICVNLRPSADTQLNLRGLRVLRGLSIAAGQRDCRVASLLAMT